MDPTSVSATSAMTVPLVTVGMPVRNCERHIGQAIESVLAQSVADLELIVSDNASTDATPDIVHRFMQRDARIRYQRFEVNRGVSANWNAVALAGRGRYFKWLAASDEMAPNLLEKCLPVLQTRPDVVLVFGLTRWLDADGESLEVCNKDFAVLADRPAERFGQVARNLSINNQINAGVIRMDALRRTRLLGRFPTDDLVLMAELALIGKIVLLPDELFRRRTGADVSTPNRTALQTALHHDPRASRPNRFLSLRRQAARYAACWRAPLPLSERLCAALEATGLLVEAWQRRQSHALAWLTRAGQATKDSSAP
jgi:glycosyltransferase involved in cell wall biosynthesis